MVITRRFYSFIFWHLLILFSTLKATTRATTTEETAFTAGRDTRPVTNRQKDNLEAVSTPKKAITGIIGGRKMMEKRVFGKEDIIHMNNQKKINIVAAEALKKISGAKHSVGNSSQGHKDKAKMNVVSKMSAKITTSTQPIKAEIGGLMALSADYHMAKSHPPRNN